MTDQWLTARVIVHKKDHISAALSTSEIKGRAVVLVSGPAVSGAMGWLWFRCLVAEVSALYKRARFTTVFDCGSAAGLAMAALADGAKAIRLHAPPPVLKRVRDIATQSGAVIDSDVRPALNLLFYSDPVAACHAWFNVFQLCLPAVREARE